MSEKIENAKSCVLEKMIFPIENKTRHLVVRVIIPIAHMVTDNEMDNLNRLLIGNFLQKIGDIPFLYNEFASDTSFALLRFPFELLILIECLFVDKSKIKRVQEDLSILNLKRCLGLNKIGGCCKHRVDNVYRQFNESLKEKIQLVYKNNQFEYNEKFLNNYEILSQKVRKNIQFLKSKKTINSKDFDKFKVMIYQISSDIIHGDFTAQQPFIFSSKDEHMRNVKYNLNLVALMLRWAKKSMDEYSLKGENYSINDAEYKEAFEGLKKFVLD